MPKSDLTQFQTRLPSDLVDWLRSEADARMVSVTYLLTRSVENLRRDLSTAERP